MRLHEFEHVLRAAKVATGEQEFVIIGSQAVLARFPDAPRFLTYSDEMDIYPLSAPEKSDLIDGTIGERSQFHDTFGYYAHGVGPETATLPLKWRERAVRYESEATQGAVAHCLSPLDIAYSKKACRRSRERHRLRERDDPLRPYQGFWNHAVDCGRNRQLQPARHIERTSRNRRDQEQDSRYAPAAASLGGVTGRLLSGRSGSRNPSAWGGLMTRVPAFRCCSRICLCRSTILVQCWRGLK